MMRLSGFDALKRAVEEESNDGRALAKSLSDNPIGEVTLDESVPCIFVRWKGYATSVQLRYIHECLIDFIERERVSRILGDDTALVSAAAEDQAWIIWNWIPLAMVAGLWIVASKIPNSYYGKTSVGRIQAVISPKIRIKSFDDLADARRWLRHPV
jgi:hypothetical protein